MNESYLKEWLEALLSAAIVVGILYFVCWPFRVDGASMEETLFHGDRIVISRVAFYTNQIRNGDVVVCNGQAPYGLIIKRLIASPGDQVSISDGKVFLNGNELNEYYLGNTTSITTGQVDIILGENEYFVLGDHRAVSLDSRHFGTISRQHLVGKVIFRWFPFHSFYKF